MLLFALTVAAVVAQPVDKPTLELYQQRFVVRSGNEVLRVPIEVRPPEPPPAVMFRRDDTYAVWDERGMTVRSGDWSFTTRLEEVSVSPRIQRREEILRTLDLERQGLRSTSARAISGSRRLGNHAYFLVRWDDALGQPWLEALVSIDMAAFRPKPVLVGRLDGLSLATEPIDDKVFVLGDRLAVVTRGPEAWGVATYRPSSEEVRFQPQGKELLGFWPRTNREGLFVERAANGTTLAGGIDLDTGARRVMYQGLGSARFIDTATPEVLILGTPAGRMAYYVPTGGSVPLGDLSELRRVGPWIIAWGPERTPTRAALFRPEGWERVVEWALGR
jgi:hypothetical protein